MSNMTRLLDAAQAGDRQAAADLLPLIYDELRKLAAARIAAEAPGHTLDATALVHEAYVRLIGPADAGRWDHCGHFFAAAAAAMRRILVDHARHKQADKRGGGMHRHDPADLPLVMPEPAEDLVALDTALDAFADVEPQKAELVKLRYFGGLTIEEAAGVLGISPATAKRHWAYSRAWLFREISGSG